MKINQIIGIEENDFLFAKLMYNISPDNRFLWLSGKIERYGKKHPMEQKELDILLNKVRNSNESK